MDNNFEYYWNDIPGVGLCRNNLIYTSLMNKSKTSFVQWYYNDSEYHKGQNEVVDPNKMQEKWEREIKYITLMARHYPHLVPQIDAIDITYRKLHLKVDGPDFWNMSKCSVDNYDAVLPDWREQMIEIVKAHRSLGLWKYSMHPSSYFIVDGKLKSINYFFAYHESEQWISIQDVQSHIYSTRQAEMRKHVDSLGIKWDVPQKFEVLNQLCWESFRTNYPADFIEEVKRVV